MGKPLMVVALTWSLMHASDIWFDSGHIIDTARIMAQQISRSFGWS